MEFWRIDIGCVNSFFKTLQKLAKIWQMVSFGFRMIEKYSLFKICLNFRYANTFLFSIILRIIFVLNACIHFVNDCKYWQKFDKYLGVILECFEKYSLFKLIYEIKITNQKITFYPFNLYDQLCLELWVDFMTINLSKFCKNFAKKGWLK